MILSLLCPSCNEKLIITVENNQIISVTVNDSIKTSQTEIANVLKQHNIEFG